MTEISLWQLFVLGGPVMWPILACSIVALAVVIEKIMFFNNLEEDIVGLKNAIFDAILKNDIKAALEVCDRSSSPTANVLKAGVLQYGQGKEDIINAMQDASRVEVPMLEERLTALSMISNITPLLGLLGTVTGMCVSFHVIQLRADALNPSAFQDLAGGIWQALLTTAAGLAVSIPSFIAYNYFASYQNRYVLRMEKSAADLARFLTHIAEAPGTNDRE